MFSNVPLGLFAGAIFTPQDIIIFCTVAFLVVGSVVGLLIFGGRKLLSLRVKHAKGNPKLLRSLLAGFIAVAVAVIIFLVIPTMIKDHNWVNKQQKCAVEAGYGSPADDQNIVTATAESQASYRLCLDR